MMVRLLIADAADLIRVGMGSILAARQAYKVEASVGTLADLMQAVALKPHVALIDERLDPDADILHIVEQVGMVAPQTRLLVSGYLRDGLLIRDLFAAGCQGYLYKGDELESALPCAIDSAMRERPFLSATANTEYLVAMQTAHRDWQLDRQARRVLRLLAQGQHVGQIALNLDLSPRRVYWIREKLRDRFGAMTNEHMISRAAAEGFIFPS